MGMRRKRKKSNDATTRSTCSSSVLNLVQSDVAIIENAALQIHTVWDILYLGKSVFWGIAVLVMTIPINALCLRVLNRLGKLELLYKQRISEQRKRMRPLQT